MSNQDPKIEEGLTGVPASGEEFSLEEILAEYGGSLEQVLLRETEEATGEEAASREASALPTPTPPAAEKQTVPSPAAQAAAPAPKEPAPEESAGEPEIPPSHYFGRCGGGYGRRRDGRGAPRALSFPTAEPVFPPSAGGDRGASKRSRVRAGAGAGARDHWTGGGASGGGRGVSESLAQPPCVTAAGISGGFDCCCAVGCGAIRSVTTYLERQFTGSESLFPGLSHDRVPPVPPRICQGNFHTAPKAVRGRALGCCRLCGGCRRLHGLSAAAG